ncbi:hypothetical protein [Chryseobacterium sp. HR92]|uniref:hypothetical protein n=1 Tax=Chryseobacterium sp. HR92 TaxID=3094839 RepID=UPI0038911230|nr:hypothetical protein SFA27_13670 [Chryseobacterium sp. HR92]
MNYIQQLRSIFFPCRMASLLFLLFIFKFTGLKSQIFYNDKYTKIIIGENTTFYIADSGIAKIGSRSFGEQPLIKNYSENKQIGANKKIKLRRKKNKKLINLKKDILICHKAQLIKSVKPDNLTSFNHQDMAISGLVITLQYSQKFFIENTMFNFLNNHLKKNIEKITNHNFLFLSNYQLFKYTTRPPPYFIFQNQKCI